MEKLQGATDLALNFRVERFKGEMVLFPSHQTFFKIIFVYRPEKRLSHDNLAGEHT